MSSDSRPAVAPQLLEVHSSILTTDPGPLLELLPEPGQLAWVREGEGLVGWGEAARLEADGPDRFAVIAGWWDELRSGWAHEDPATAPVAFLTIDFDGQGTSTAIVPQVLIGRRAGKAWITRVGPAALRKSVPVAEPGPAHVMPGRVGPAEWGELVVRAVEEIRGGALHKVVLSRDVVVHASAPIDDRYVLGRLAERYPQCWTFAVDGLVGATPELLLRTTAGRTESLVLAGSSSVGEVEDRLDTGKNQSEHRYAVESLVASLSALGATVTPPPPPHELRLPNLLHLATWVTSNARGSLLEVAAGVHPTAAVGGTPTPAALELIAELEPSPRGRYLGPVGYLDSAGDGELGVALRCAQISGSTARLWAGCGIVADSEPAEELAETGLKFRPLLEALGATED